MEFLPVSVTSSLTRGDFDKVSKHGSGDRQVSLSLRVPPLLASGDDEQKGRERTMKTNPIFQILPAACLLLAAPLVAQQEHKTSGNPVFEGWYADPEGVIFGDTYWVYPTYSAPYDKQVFFDCFSSKDLVTWTKHARILDTNEIKWARRAMWAPSIIE